MTRSVNYDSVADQFDKRYERSDYGPISRLLLEFAKGPRSGPVLEVGCGTGHWLAEIAGLKLPCFGLDPSRNMLETAARKQTGATIIQSVAEALPLADDSSARLFCINSFHHFQDKERFVAEAARVIRPGGTILILGLDPHNGLDEWWIYDYFPQVIEIDKARYPPTKDIRDMLERHGFTACRTEVALHMPIRIEARSALENGQLDEGATSQTAVLTDGEYHKGMQRLVIDIKAAEARGQTLVIGADLRVYATIATRAEDLRDNEPALVCIARFFHGGRLTGPHYSTSDMPRI